MLKIKNILIMVLMSSMVSGVCAQTSKTKWAIEESIEASDSLAIRQALEKKAISLNETDRQMVETMLYTRTNAVWGCVGLDGAITSKSKYGDDWVAYISYKDGNYYLIYEVTTANNKPVGTVTKKI